jgi:hypothetical protein
VGHTHVLKVHDSEVSRALKCSQHHCILPDAKTKCNELMEAFVTRANMMEQGRPEYRSRNAVAQLEFRLLKPKRNFTYEPS